MQVLWSVFHAIVTCCSPAADTPKPRKSWTERPRTLIYSCMGPEVAESARADVVKRQLHFRQTRRRSMEKRLNTKRLSLVSEDALQFAAVAFIQAFVVVLRARMRDGVPSYKRAAYVPPLPGEYTERFENLQRRFQSLSPATIAAVLYRCRGHAGHAAYMLESENNCVAKSARSVHIGPDS